jgi:hypothetical protein
LNLKKTTTYDVGNPGPGLGQAHKCGRVKSVNGIPTLLLLIIGSPMAVYHNQVIANMDIFACMQCKNI